MVRILLALVLATTVTAVGEPARIHVFVALADNASQGIIPVPAKIGDGNDPKGNLYWGCSEALPPVFKASRDWKLVSTAAGPKASILERVVFAHRSGKYEVIADAYRGSAIMECTTDFFAALASDAPVERSPLIAYIGHDGLMDFALPEIATPKRGPGRQAIVLAARVAITLVRISRRSMRSRFCSPRNSCIPVGFFFVQHWTDGSQERRLRKSDNARQRPMPGIRRSV
jgi:hypothetical protein